MTDQERYVEIMSKPMFMVTDEELAELREIVKRRIEFLSKER